MGASSPYEIFFLGDRAATIHFGNIINEDINKQVIGLFDHVCRYPVKGMIEAIPAYSSLTIYFDLSLLRAKSPVDQELQDLIRDELQALMKTVYSLAEPEVNLVRIPVCYDPEFAPDLAEAAREKKIDVEEFVLLHLQKRYRVFMLGFLPGFSYMGELDEKIAVPRKSQPRPVLAGSVGIAGRQTGIYPVNSPGGWQIIGRTPLQMFDRNAGQPCLLMAGDYVEFHSITRHEFENYPGRGA